jgi:two-component system, LuxR family, response regulator FixJ
VKEGHREEATKRVLAVIEDDFAVRESLRFSLEVEGFEVHTYPSPSEFLNNNKQLDFDCLIVDYHLPRTNGLEVIAKVRELDNSVGVILLTGNPDPRMRRAAATAGVTVVEKSSGAQVLLQCIRNAIAAR